MSRRLPATGRLSMLVVLTLATAAAASAQATHTLRDISFLSGCWAGTTGSLEMEEHWSEAAGGVMLGTTRYLRDGRVVDWEFGRFVEDEGGVTLWPYPRGTMSEHGFRLVRTDGAYVFENLEHDFPVRIVYVRHGENALRPRIEGRDGEGPGWALERVACPGAGAG